MGCPRQQAIGSRWGSQVDRLRRCRCREHFCRRRGGFNVLVHDYNVDVVTCRAQHVAQVWLTLACLHNEHRSRLSQTRREQFAQRVTCRWRVRHQRCRQADAIERGEASA